MTEQEAMNVLEKYTDDTLSPVVVEAHRMAITALEEVRQYQAMQSDIIKKGGKNMAQGNGCTGGQKGRLLA